MVYKANIVTTHNESEIAASIFKQIVQLAFLDCQTRVYYPDDILIIQKKYINTIF